VSCSRWRLFSAVIATIALAVTAMDAGPATAAVPGPPTSVTARGGDQLAEVTWAAPTPDDPTITGYTITASPADTPPVTVGGPGGCSLEAPLGGERLASDAIGGVGPLETAGQLDSIAVEDAGRAGGQGEGDGGRRAGGVRG
jgi:hypothetical protein